MASIFFMPFLFSWSVFYDPINIEDLANCGHGIRPNFSCQCFCPILITLEPLSLRLHSCLEMFQQIQICSLFLTTLFPTKKDISLFSID
jgi:hypothetical protein